MALGKTIKTLRESRGWTLKELAKRSNVPWGTIGALEVRDSVRSEYAASLAKGFEISLDDLQLLSDGILQIGDINKMQQNQPQTPVNQTQVATINVAPEVAQLCQMICNEFAKVAPDDRMRALSKINAAIDEVRGPPSNRPMPELWQDTKKAGAA